MIYFCELHFTEKWYLKTHHLKEVDQKFVEEHPWIPRVYYDRNSVAGWDSSYTDPSYATQFFCETKDINTVIYKGIDMLREANLYRLETEAMRLYLKEMDTNVSAAIFLRDQAKLRWDWASDTENLEKDFVGWEDRVDEIIEHERRKRKELRKQRAKED